MSNVSPTVIPHQGYVQSIDGSLVTSADKFAVINPSTAKPFADCPAASREEFERAVAAARRAFPAWREAGYEVRRKLLHEFAEAMEADIEGLSAILTAEQGKPLARAKEEVIRAASHMKGLSMIDVPQEQRTDSTGKPYTIRYRPLGVVGAITPWNMPVILGIWKIAHALYTGNTIVLKPSPYTPLATLRLGELATKIFPPGVLNVVAGTDDLGRWMTEHPQIDKISFTGSVRTGKLVMASAASTLKRVTLELGGNDAAVVLGDVNPKSIVDRLFHGAFVNSGQVCMAIKRLYVQDNVFDAVCEELGRVAANARVGDGFDPNVTMGPVQNAMQHRIVSEVLKEAQDDPKAEILGGHQRLPRDGYFVAPRVVAHPSEDSRIVQEETFGPLLPVMKFSDVDEVLERANSTRYGLSGSVWGKDVDKAASLAERLEAGTAWVNQHVGSDPLVPFGGLKESGIGREMSLLGLKHYLEPQVLSVRPL